MRSDSLGAAVNGDKKPTTNGEKKVNGNVDKTNLAIPASVVEEALRVTRESLETVCEVEESAGQ